MTISELVPHHRCVWHTTLSPAQVREALAPHVAQDLSSRLVGSLTPWNARPFCGRLGTGSFSLRRSSRRGGIEVEATLHVVPTGTVIVVVMSLPPYLLVFLPFWAVGLSVLVISQALRGQWQLLLGGGLMLTLMAVFIVVSFDWERRRMGSRLRSLLQATEVELRRED